MWYFVVYAIFAAWVLIDGIRRKAHAVPWALGTVVLGPVVLPIYIATRPLKAGEVREGGTTWNVLKNFALFWTAVMIFASIWYLVTIGQMAGSLHTEAEQAGAAIGGTIGVGILGAVWFFPMLGALVLGLFVKNSSVVERGPTGPLVGSPEPNESGQLLGPSGPSEPILTPATTRTVSLPTSELPQQPGNLVGQRYRILERVGGGGMKKVFLAEDSRLEDRRCALAEMVDNFSTSEEREKAVAAFQRECRLLATFDDPHIPRIYDCFSEQERHYFVMEYVEGVTVEQMLASAGGSIDEGTVVAVALEVLGTLCCLHSLSPPVIYRDLKPSNIMVTPTGGVRLVDFGIARHFQPSKTMTTIGTQGYAAPEQYIGKAETRSDIYALGAVIHQVVSGRDPALQPPFSFPPLARLRPQVSPVLAECVDQALSYDPTGRPASAAEMRERLLQLPHTIFSSLIAPADFLTVKGLQSAEAIAGAPPETTAIPTSKTWVYLLLLFCLAAVVLSVAFWMDIKEHRHSNSAGDASRSEPSAVSSEATRLSESDRMAAVEREKAAREQELLAEVRSIPESDWARNLARYIDLLALRPGDKTYKRKVEHYKRQLERLDCNPYERDFGIEALCLYAEDSALAGHLPDNPITRDSMLHYLLYQDFLPFKQKEEAIKAIVGGHYDLYLNSRLGRVHACYEQKKVNLCGKYHSH